MNETNSASDEREKEHKHRHSHATTPAEKRGERVAMDVETVLGCTVTDFIDPPVMTAIQNWYARRHGGEIPGQEHNWKGEGFGDAVGAGILVGCDALFSRKMEKLSHKTSHLLDPIYRWSAVKSGRLEPGNEESEHHYKKWRNYQVDSLMRTAAFSTLATAANVASQKLYWKNPSPTIVILGSKIAGAVLTMAAVSSYHLAEPREAKAVESWLSRNIFAPILRQTDKLLGSNKDKDEELEKLSYHKEEHDTPSPAILNPQEVMAERVHPTPAIGEHHAAR